MTNAAIGSGTFPYMFIAVMTQNMEPVKARVPASHPKPESTARRCIFDRNMEGNQREPGEYTKVEGREYERDREDRSRRQAG